MADDLTAVREAVTTLVEEWSGDRRSRQARRHLEREDFDRLTSTGFLRCVVPVDHGGLWEDTPRSVRPVAQLLRLLAQGDSSVALVSAMHPAVVGYWLLLDDPDPAWQQQRRAVFETALAGEQWGTITSEPGSGGDISRTRTRAVPAPEAELPLSGQSFRLSGDKHFGSGSGVSSYMITTALPDDGDEPALFVLDVRDRPWDGGVGMSVVAEWDGMGMAATQSHAMRLDDMPAIKSAWEGPLDDITRTAGPFIACLFTAVVLGVLDIAVATARPQIAERATDLRAFEQVEWSRAEMDHWLAIQAFEGALSALERGSPAEAGHAAIRAKESVARLAEDTLQRLTRVLGGGTFSQRSPFAHWFEDVRALGFLRPPWGLAHDMLFLTSLDEV